MKSYTHFKQEERCEIAILLKKGYSIRDIAYSLKRSPSSVSREITNNKVLGIYDSSKANHKAYFRRKYSKFEGMKIQTDNFLKDYIKEKLKLTWSPEQIAGRLKLETNGRYSLHHKTIYKHLYSSYGQSLCCYLRYKHYRNKKRKQIKTLREIIKNRVFIDLRPKIINQRKRFGDFEGDTMGVPKYTTETLALLLERRSRYILGEKIKRLKEAMVSFKQLLINLGAKSVTFDNGPENARHKELKTKTYFCHPYSSWEKGAVENAIGLLREFIPKKTNLAFYDQNQIRVIIDLINQRPRKCLSFRTPEEVFKEHIIKMKCCTWG